MTREMVGRGRDRNRVFSVLPFSGFSSFRAFENFVRVSVRAFGLIRSNKVGKIKTE